MPPLISLDILYLSSYELCQDKESVLPIQNMAREGQVLLQRMNWASSIQFRNAESQCRGCQVCFAFRINVSTVAEMPTEAPAEARGWGSPPAAPAESRSSAATCWAHRGRQQNALRGYAGSSWGDRKPLQSAEVAVSSQGKMAHTMPRGLCMKTCPCFQVPRYELPGMVAKNSPD